MNYLSRYGIETLDASDEEVADKLMTKMFYEHLCPTSVPVTSSDNTCSRDSGIDTLLHKGKQIRESFLECSKMSPAAAVERCTAKLLPSPSGTCGDLECGVNTDSDDETVHVMKVVRNGLQELQVQGESAWAVRLITRSTATKAPRYSSSSSKRVKTFVRSHEQQPVTWV